MANGSYNGGNLGRVDPIALGLAVALVTIILTIGILSVLGKPIPDSLGTGLSTIVGAFAGAYTFGRKNGNGNGTNGTERGVATNSVSTSPGVKAS